MKTIWGVVVALTLSLPTFATPIELTGTSNVKIQGDVAIHPLFGGATDHYLDTRAATGNLTAYSVDLANQATATGIAASPEFFFFGMDHSVTSRARQTTATTPNSISLTSYVNAYRAPNSQIGWESAFASSDYNVMFRIQTATAYTFNLNALSFISTAPYGNYIAPNFSFVAVDGSMGLGMSDTTRDGGLNSSSASWSLNRSGLLSPGDYQLSYSVVTAGSIPDPIGVSSSSSILINLGLTAVPESGSAVGCILLGLSVLRVLGRRFQALPEK